MESIAKVTTDLLTAVLSMFQDAHQTLRHNIDRD